MAKQTKSSVLIERIQGYIYANNQLLRRKIETLERKCDEQFQHVFNVLAQMAITDGKPGTPIWVSYGGRWPQEIKEAA